MVHGTIPSEARRAPFVGRQGILETLARERVVIVRAVAGGGKSRLLAESRRAARGEVVVTIRCHRSVLATYEPLEALLATARRRVPTPLQVTRMRPGGDADRLLAIREAFERLAAERPLTVQIDDVHEASAATVEAIAFCIDRTRDSAIRWQLATRPEATNGAALDAMRRDDEAVVVDVPPLDEAETAEFARQMTSETPPGLYRATGGNPLYVEQLLVARASPVAASTLRSTLDARLAELSAGETRIARVFALANRAMTAPEAARVLAEPLARVAAVCGDLAIAGILHADGESFEFAHDLLREACDAAVDAETRAAVHLELAAVARDDRERGDHLAGAGRPREAVEAYLRALRGALYFFAFEESTALVERIETVAPPAPGVRWQIGAARAIAHTAKNGYPADPAAWHEFTDRGRALDVDVDVWGFYLERLVATIGRPENAAAARCIDAALAEPALESELRGLFLSWLVRARFGAQDDAAAIELADTALALVSPDSDVGFMVRALRAMSVGAADPETARAEFRALVGEPSYRALPSYTFVFHCAAAMEERHDDARAVLDWARAGIAIPASRRLRALYYHAASAELDLGSVTRAIEVQTALHAHAAQTGRPPTVPNAALFARALIWHGELDRARSLLEGVGRRAATAADAVRVFCSRAALAEAEGRRDDAMAAYARAARDFETGEETHEAIACAAIVRLRALAGDREPVARELARLRAASLRGPYANRELAEAEFYATLGAAPLDERATRDAIEAYERMLPARATVLARAVALSHLGERLHDRAKLLEAIEIFDAAPAPLEAARTRAAARALGLRPGTKERTRRVLTTRESEIVRAVAEGLTNREIAEQIHVSPKTVAAGISAVLFKCGLRSRVEIAAHVAAGKSFTRAAS